MIRDHDRSEREFQASLHDKTLTDSPVALARATPHRRLHERILDRARGR